MAKCCGGSSRTQQRAGAAVQGLAAPVTTAPADGRVKMRFRGQQRGGVTFNINRRSYQGGNNPLQQFIRAHPDDVDGLLKTGQWERVHEQTDEPPVDLLALVASAGEGVDASSSPIGPPPDPVAPFVPEADHAD